ncbi:alpha-mannosidase [Spirochaetia bacterium]|nr:alpha-mannosidase [Spirochaetia bacterium]
MLLQLERIQRICAQLKGHIYSKSLPIEEYQFAEGNFHDPEDLKRQNPEWKNFKTGELWGGRDYHGWFKTSVTVPRDYAGKTLALVFYTFEEGWDAVNPQFFFYLNGELIQGLDMNHREVIISEKAQGGVTYDIDLHAYAGMLSDKKCTLYGSLSVLEQETRALYFDIQVPVWSCEKLESQDKRRIDMLSVLNEAVNRIDFREPFSAEYFAGIKKAREFMQREFYEKLCGHDDVIATCVGHTHIDVAWKWTVAQTREKTGRSFSTALKLMDQYPEYVFMSSQPQLYEFIKEDYPELYEKIKDRIREGRWEDEGAMWLEADCNVTSGESLVRQLLYGKRFFKDEFGNENKILWLPDVFGYSAALPQLLKKAGVDYFVTSKISWNQFNRLPYDTFRWKGIDGTEILTYFITAKTPYYNKDSWFSTYNTEIHPGAIIGGWEEYRQKDITNNIMIPFGFGDGGGGPTFEMLEVARRMAKGIPGTPKLKMGTTLDYFTELEKTVKDNKRLPAWSGELYLEYHRGTYTSMARNKRDNRKAENLYQSAEKLNVFSMTLGKKYPEEAFKKGWKKILLNQFHDILPGSSIKDVYDITREEYKTILSAGTNEAKSALAHVASRINLAERSLVVYNPLSIDRDDIVEFDIPQGIIDPCLKDAAGNELPCQKIDGSRVICFVRSMPANGYKVFAIAEKRTEKTNTADVKISPQEIENQFFYVSFNEAMNFTSVYDKRNRRELLRKGQTGKQLQAFEDIPITADNWDIDIYYTEKMWNVDDVQEVNVLETGPIRYALQVKRRFNRSVINETIYVYRDIPRIDCKYFIDWKQAQVLLKTAFPIDINTNEATYEIQYGNITRPTHWNTSWDEARFEVCGHSWADISEGGFGVSLLNDSKYGYDIKDGIMRLTLLKSGIDPNPEADKEEHEFTYSLYPHKDTWREGGTHFMARGLNIPLFAHIEDPHAGDLEKEYSFVRSDRDNVCIEVIKKAEDGDDIIVRLYEYQNKRTEVKLVFHHSCREIHECDLLERVLEKIGSDTNEASFVIKPYEIKTFRLKRGTR